MGVTIRNGKEYFIVYDPNYDKAKSKYSGGVIDAGNGKIYVPTSVMEKDVAYTVTISK